MAISKNVNCLKDDANGQALSVHGTNKSEKSCLLTETSIAKLWPPWCDYLCVRLHKMESSSLRTLEGRYDLKRLPDLIRTVTLKASNW